MSAKHEEFKKGLRKLNDKPFHAIAGTVLEVDRTELTVDVAPLDGGAELFSVRLRAAIDDNQGGFVLIPVKGSTVLVSAVADNWNAAFVSMVSEVELVTIKTEKESLKQWALDLLTTVQQLTVPTPAGPSGVPINTPAFKLLAKRLDNLFLD